MFFSCWNALFSFTSIWIGNLVPLYEQFQDTSSVVERIKLVCRGMTVMTVCPLEKLTSTLHNNNLDKIKLLNQKFT